MSKHNDPFGPWSMSVAQKCRLDSFWKKRFDGLSNLRPNPSRRDWVFGIAMMAMIVFLPTLRLELSNAIAEERPIDVFAPDPTATVDPSPAKGASAQRNTSMATYSPAESQQLIPNELTLSMHVGQAHKLGMPNDCKVTVSAPGVFSAVTDDQGDVTIHPKKPGEGILKLEFDSRASLKMKIVVLIDPAPLSKSLKQNGLDHIDINPLTNSVVLTGQVPTLAEMKKCLELAKRMYPKVVNNLTVGEQRQVALHCQVFEFEADEANVDATLKKMCGAKSSRTNGIVTTVLDGDAFDSTLRTIRKSVKVKLLASPTLTTVSGRPAAFNAGGEFPILIPQGRNTVAVEYKQFGTRVDFVPVVLGNDRLRLEVRPQISQLESGDPPVMVGDSGKRLVEIPRLKKRWLDTAAELSSGQTMVIALVDKRANGRLRCFTTLVRPELISKIAAENTVPNFGRH